MRKLLNTIYITNEQAYLTLDGENLVCKVDKEEKLRIPFDNVENIVCFNYIGCSPALIKRFRLISYHHRGNFWQKYAEKQREMYF